MLLSVLLEENTKVWSLIAPGSLSRHMLFPIQKLSRLEIRCPCSAANSSAYVMLPVLGSWRARWYVARERWGFVVLLVLRQTDSTGRFLACADQFCRKLIKLCLRRGLEILGLLKLSRLDINGLTADLFPVIWPRPFSFFVFAWGNIYMYPKKLLCIPTNDKIKMPTNKWVRWVGGVFLERIWGEGLVIRSPPAFF